ncbi:MAG: FKBP-type peptidyl-prolyl cis-trans isomerase [Winogradskyella sp.]
MNSKILKLSMCLLIAVSVLVSCDPDDDGPTTTFEERDRATQQLADKDSLQNYFSTHYYNSGFFETGTNHSYTDIVISALEDGETVPANHTLLSNAVETRTTTYLDVAYEYYVLNINQGAGDAPKFTDLVRVKYEGSSVENGNVFDSKVSPQDLALTGNGFSTFGTIRAWQLVMPTFNSALDFTPNNGVIDFNNFGLGVMFVPSGLAYFSSGTTGLTYDNLVFKFELLQVQQEDHDNDGVPSYLEDLDNNLDAFDDDTDEDVFPNYLDADDDGDEVLTRNELTEATLNFATKADAEAHVLQANEIFVDITEEEQTGGTIEFVLNYLILTDSDSNGIYDYLEADIAIDYSL